MAFLDTIFAPRVAARVYGLGAIALGLVGLVWADFAAVWQPVAKSVPGRTALAYAVAAVLLLAGAAIQWQRTAARAAVILTALYCLGVILLHLPLIFSHPSIFFTWSGAAEQLALVAGGLAAYASCAHIDPAASERMAKVARLMFGLCLIFFGFAHIFYPKETAEAVPAWLPPGQAFWAYATAGGHLAAGIAILTGFAARAGAMLLTAMFIVFGIFVHAPTILMDPHTHLNWAANAINLALIGSAWVIAASIPAPSIQAFGAAGRPAGTGLAHHS